MFIIKFRLGMSLTKQKDSLIRERDRLTTEVDDLNKRLQQQRQQTDAIEKRRLELEEKCRELYKSLDVSLSLSLLVCNNEQSDGCAKTMCMRNQMAKHVAKKEC